MKIKIASVNKSKTRLKIRIENPTQICIQKKTAQNLPYTLLLNKRFRQPGSSMLPSILSLLSFNSSLQNYVLQTLHRKEVLAFNTTLARRVPIKFVSRFSSFSGATVLNSPSHIVLRSLLLYPRGK